jgi:hypothetical protein
MTRFEMILSAMDRTGKAAAKKGYAAASEKGASAVNPFHKLTESRKHSAWQVGYEMALRGEG